MTSQMIAFVYPGWHRDEYRPEVDEWDLLKEAKPRFMDHKPLARPVNGQYDDTDSAVAGRQIREAELAGICAFSYFLYWGPNGYVMNTPMAVARDVAADLNRGFQVGGTWCVRLPHDHFPISAGDNLGSDARAEPQDSRREDRQLTSLSIGELQALIPGWDPDWLDSTEPDVGPSSEDAHGSLSELCLLIDDLVDASADELSLPDVMTILIRRNSIALSIASVSKLLTVVAVLRASASKCGALPVRELEHLAAGL